MSAITIEIEATELTEAINNLARAQMAAAEALNRLTGNQAFTNTTYGLNPGNTNKASGYAFTSQPAASVSPTYEPPLHPTTAPAALSVTDSALQSNPFSLSASKLSDSNITLDDLARAASTLMGSGKYMLLVELLGKFGVQALSQLPKEHFGAFAAALRKLGAFI